MRQPLTITRRQITAQKQDIWTIFSSSGRSKRRQRQAACLHGIRFIGRAAGSYYIRLVGKKTQRTLGPIQCLVVVEQNMARQQLSIKQSYANICQGIFSQEEHTFDPRSCNNKTFLTPRAKCHASTFSS